MKRMGSDLVAVWEVPLNDMNHKVEFEHGTTSGKRIIRVDGKEVLHKDWVFKLVGSEYFEIGKSKCQIRIAAISGFMYEYTLTVDGKLLEMFRERQSKIMNTWTLDVDGEPTRIVLEKNTLDIWVNGEKVETTGEFVEEGTETHFVLGQEQQHAYIKAVSTGDKKEGILHSLIINDTLIPESLE